MNRISFIALAVASLLFSSAVSVGNSPEDKTGTSRSSSTSTSRDNMGTQNVTTPSDSSQRQMMNRMEDRNESMKGVDRMNRSMDTRVDKETSTFKTDMHKDKGVFEKDKAVFSGFKGDSTVVIQVRDVIRKDPVFVSFANDVDFIECDGNIIIFGVVPSVKERTAIETKVKSIQGVSNVQNKLILKNK